MIALLARAAGRFHRRHPWQLALAVAGVGLGVAVYVGVDLASASARHAFDLSADTLRGGTTHRLLPVAGTLAEQRYADLVTSGRVDAAAPVVEVTARAGAPDGPAYVVLGVDPLEEIGFRDYARVAPGATAGPDLGRLLVEPDSVFVPPRATDELGVAAGDELALWVEGRRRDVVVAGTLDDGAAAGGARAPIVTDIATAQVVADAVGRLTRIDLRLSSEQAQGLRETAPAGTTLVEAGADTDALDEMARAFTTNLTALGLLALVVGMFMIYSTMSFTIVQRREVIGMFRALGVDDARLFASFMAEAAAVGFVGTVLGLVLGRVLAEQLTGMVLATIGDFYFSREVAAVDPPATIYFKGAALGLGATLVAGLAPARDAVSGSTDAALRRSVQERRSVRRSRAAAIASPGAFAIAAALLLAPARNLEIAFAALFFVLAGAAMLTPAATRVLMAVLEPVGRRLGLPVVLALREVGAGLSRTGVATAALAVAVATVVGIGLMIESFRASLVTWLDTSLTADIYVTFTEPVGGDDLSERLAALEETRGVEGYGLTRSMRLPSRFGEIGLQALAAGPEGFGIDIVQGDAGHALERLAADSDAVVIAEQFAYRHGLEPGERIELPTAAGHTEFTIVGMYRDYSTTGNAAAVALDTFRRHWQSGGVTGIGVHVMRDAAFESVLSDVRAVFADLSVARLRSTRFIEDLSLRVFDRTFRITEVLRLLAGIVAFLGILSAAVAIQLERARQTAIMRALGFSPRALVVLILAQTGLLGLAAGIVALPLGTVLSALLVFVINRRSFGWSMDFIVDAIPLLSGLGLAVGAALLAGIYPALLGVRRSLQQGLRDE